MKMGRILCQFSCGVTSAVAGKMVLSERPLQEVVLLNAYIAREDEDNRRFLADCEIWLGQKMVVLRDEKYGADPEAVWLKRRYMKGQHGAPCSMELKRKLLAAYQQPGDIIVLGFDALEDGRAAELEERFPNEKFRFPLIERGLTKADCLAMVQRAGIVLPLMYRDGFENANCPGCPKGGEGYWNRIRLVRPSASSR